MRINDLIKKPARPQRPLTYTESLQAKLNAQMSTKPTPKFTALEWAIMEGGGSLEDAKVNELFEPEQASPLDWSKGLNSTYAEGEIEINGHSVSIDITFTNMEDGIVDIEFAVGGQFDLTGRGGASQVFATVINAIKEFVADHPKITTITFTAHEQSRAKMYDTLAKRVSKQVGWHVIPYDEMIADPRLHGNSGEFTFAIQKGQAPAHRQAAQKPQHGEFIPVFYVYAYENPKLPIIKIKAKKSMDAEMWAIKNVPGYDNEHPMSIFTTKTPPEGRTDIIDKGSVPVPKKPEAQDPNSLSAQLRAKLDAPQNENFADGRNPQDKGDSKRHGVPTKASVSTLRKVAKQGGRKGQLAHWMANMKAGKAKK